MLLSTGVGHTRAALLRVLHATGDRYLERAPGLFEVWPVDGVRLVQTAGRNLSPAETAEVRAVIVSDEQGDALLAAALTAPTLSQLMARVEHADLLPLFGSELESFRCVYQPIVTLAEGAQRVVGYEALLRARSATGELMPRAMFAAAQQAGWLHVLDRIGRTTALRGAAGWLGDASLFVNFLPSTIYRPQGSLVTTERAAEDAGLRLDQLVFEVTESEQVNDLDHLERVLDCYRERGCKVALDDLGAGYSSLNMLVRLKPDIVKLDKEIVQRLLGPVSRSVVSAVVEITHAYGGLVLAECVETVEQAATARELGVDLGQGWFFGRPQERMNPPTNSRPDTGTARAGAVWSAGVTFAGGDPAVALGADAAAPPDQHRGSADVEALLTRAIELTSSGVSIADARQADMPLIYVNEAFLEMTGYLSSEVLARNCRFLQGPDTDVGHVQALRAALAAGEDHVSVVRNYRKDGTAFWNELRISAVRDNAGEVTHFFGFQNDVTARVEAECRGAYLADHDPLTGLPNRARVLAGLDGELLRAARSGAQVAVLFLDLDGFKDVNDSLGHEAGDLVLVAAATRLRHSLREGDLVGRYSGDEFLAVITNVGAGTAQAIARRACDSILDTFHSPFDLPRCEVRVGASIGVALFPQHGRTSAELVHAADHAMYTAKNAGRGQAVLAPPSPASTPPRPGPAPAHPFSAEPRRATRSTSMSP